MSFWSEKWAYEQEPRTSGAKFVLVCVAHHADEDGYCYPSQARIAAMTGLGERAVRGHLAALEEDGYIVRETRRNKAGQRTSDGIWLQVPKDELKLPAENAARQKPTGKKRQNQPAKNDRTNRQNLPGNGKKKEPSVEPSESARDGEEPKSTLAYLNETTRKTVACLMGIPSWDRTEARTVELVVEVNRTFPHLDALATATLLAFKIRTGAVGPYKKPSKAFANWAASDASRSAAVGLAEPHRRKKKEI